MSAETLACYGKEPVVINLPPIETSIFDSIQCQAGQSIEALTERLRFSHPSEDASVVTATLYAGIVLAELSGDEKVQFSERGGQMVLSQAYMVYGALDRQMRNARSFWEPIASLESVNFYPQTLPSVNGSQARAALNNVNFGEMREAVAHYDPYIARIMKGACGRPLDRNEYFAAEHACLAVYSILNTYVRPLYLR